MTPSHIDNTIVRYPVLNVCRDEMESAFGTLYRTFFNGGKLLVCGNGGSAADAEHIVGELMKGFLLRRTIPAHVRSALCELAGEDIGARLQGGLPALSLGAHTALLTAVANDTSAEMIFAQQVYTLGRSGDTLLGISTSGNSINIIRALQVARHRNMQTIILSGRTGGQMLPFADVAVRVPATSVTAVQELHLPVYHAICAELESAFFE